MIEILGMHETKRGLCWISVLVLIGSSLLTSCGAKGPDVTVEATDGGEGLGSLRVTSEQDEPFTVQRIVVNGRKGELGCDSDETKKYNSSPDRYDMTMGDVPSILKRGDGLNVVVRCGAKILQADVYTDQGNLSVRF